MDFDPKIVDRFFKGTYSRKDYLNIKSVFSDLETRSKLKQYVESHWNDFSREEMPTETVEHLLDKIHHKISLEKGTSHRISFLTVFQRAAAILIIPLLLSFLAVFYFQSGKESPPKPIVENTAYAEIQCPLGVRTRFQLPDGTTGFLNSGSTLKYPVRFSGERNVTVSGEAYFDVTHDPSNPFVVHTSHLNVKVLGTQFNVIAYEDDKNEEVILNNGKVEIATKNGAKLDILQPNQKLVLDTEKRIYKTTRVEASQYIGWIEGKLIFRNENMQQVAERLGRWYNAEIRIEDEELLEHSFHATFIDEPLEEVLKFMALTTPYTYKILPRATGDDNIYQKRIVLVKLDQKRLKAFN